MIRIDTKEKEVELDDHSRLKYTKLIYATGSECFYSADPGRGSGRSRSDPSF